MDSGDIERVYMIFGARLKNQRSCVSEMGRRRLQIRNKLPKSACIALRFSRTAPLRVRF